MMVKENTFQRFHIKLNQLSLVLFVKNIVITVFLEFWWNNILKL